MESSIRRLDFSSEDGYESCESFGGLCSIEDNALRSTSMNPHHPSFQAGMETTNGYTIQELTNELLCADGLFGIEMDHLHSGRDEEYDVLPQKLENFQKIQEPRKTKILFTEDGSKKEVSKAINTEFKMIKSKLKRSLNLNDRLPNLDDLVTFFFGPSSKITNLFLEHLEIDYLMFLKFISTILVLMTYRLSMTLLQHDDSMINKTKLQNECVNIHQWSMIWDKISKPSSLHVDSLWLRLQKEFNTQMRVLILEGDRNHFEESLRMVLDDDKIHCDGIKCSWDGIKRVKHEKSNRFGCNLHSLVSALTHIVYSVYVEKNSNSTIHCVEECLAAAFPKKNTTRDADLKKIIVGFDRGYNGFLNLVAFILKSGGHTFGTSKRALHNIYTYDQKKRLWDKRVFKKKEGAKLTERMICPIKDSNDKAIGNLTSLFYRNGWGGAVLMQSTVPSHSCDAWDRVGVNKRNKYHNNHKELYKPHPYLKKSGNENAIALCQNKLREILSTRLLHVTIDQNVPEWFLARMFCVTASPAQQYIAVGLQESTTSNTRQWLDLKDYGMNSSNNGLQDYRAIQLNSSGDNVIEWASELFDDSDGTDWLRSVNNLQKLQNEATACKTTLNKWRAVQKEFHKRSNYSQGYTTVTPEIISYYMNLNEDEKILFDLDTSDKMRKRLREVVPRLSPLYRQIKNLSNEELRQQLLIHRSVPRKTYMDCLLATTFMQKSSSADTRLGHTNEPIIMQNAIMESERDYIETIYKIDFASTVGLVSALDKEYLHASPDFILLVSKNGQKEVAFAEIKCRTKANTAAREYDVSVGHDRWIEVQASSFSFKTYVKSIKERFQLIHQAATMQIRKCVLIIGDKDGEVIRGIWIRFSRTLLDSYRHCLNEIYQKNFAFTMNAVEGQNEARTYINAEQLENIKEAIKKQEYVDLDSFLYNFKVWVSLRKQNMPLLTSKRCIPSIAALWNRTKNGSDVATGIIRGCWYPLPHGSRNPPALVVQRIIFLVLINIMKIATFLSFEEDNDNFEDVDKFRNKSNRMFGSHRAFLLHVRRKCLVPMINKEIRRTSCVQEEIFNESIQTPEALHNATPRPPAGAQTRSKAKIRHITDINDNLKITDTTPTSRNKNIDDHEQRILNCISPCLAKVVGKGKKCVRCKKTTKTFCLGCHQYMCMHVTEEQNVEQNIPERFKEDATEYNVYLGKRKSKVQLNELTPNGTRRRKTTRKDIKVRIQATCYNIVHNHHLNNPDSSVNMARNLHTPHRGHGNN